MSSREIAELTGKNHADVLRDVRVMLAELEDGSDLSHVREEKDERGYTAFFNLPKDLTITLMRQAKQAANKAAKRAEQPRGGAA